MATPSGPLNLQTIADRELADAPRGAELVAGVARIRSTRSPVIPTYTPIDTGTRTDLAMRWGDLQERNPEWRGDYWAECRALYAGGERLLADMDVLKRLFPSHLHEDASVYRARCSRAHYFPYPGTIIDHMLSGLGTDPLTISFRETDESGTVSKLPPEAQWWAKWITDVTDEAERPTDYVATKGDEDDDEDDDEGGKPIHDFLVEVLREALQTRTAWVLADLPETDPDKAATIDSALAAERAGINDPYLCLVPAEQVIDWCCDSRGKLEWVLMLIVEQPRPSPQNRRKGVLHTYTYWTSETWARYEIQVDPSQPISTDRVFQPSTSGTHGFGRVPFERLVLPEGLYAMGKLHSLAREHFNKRCAMSWAEYKSLMPILYEFLGSEDKSGMPVAQSQTDPDRATNQVRGQGYTQVRGYDDKAMYVGPPSEAFVAARESCNDTMREMHRVMFSMALSANMDSKALNRSAESKGKDEATTTVLLDAFATILVKFARRLLVLAALGRRSPVPTLEISGLEDFDTESVTAAINEAVAFLTGVPQLSPLVKELALAKVYGAYLGSMTPEQTEKMRDQIRDGISAEEMAAEQLAGMGDGPAGAPARGPDSPGDPSDPKDPAPAPAPAPSEDPGPTPKRKSAKT